MTSLHLTSQLLLAGVFGVSALSKFRRRGAFEDFVGALAGMRVMPSRAVRTVAVAVVVAELAVVALLLLPGTARGGLALAAALLLAFTAAIVAVSLRGTRAPCRCFGASDTPLGGAHLARNLLLLAVVAAGMLSAPPPAYDAPTVTVSAFTAFAGVLVTVFLVEFVSLFARPPARAAPAPERRGSP